MTSSTNYLPNFPPTVLCDIIQDDVWWQRDSDSNTGLLRGVLPHKLFGWPQILCAMVPIVASPDEPLGSTTGLGDINIFDVLLFMQFPLTR